MTLLFKLKQLPVLKVRHKHQHIPQSTYTFSVEKARQNNSYLTCKVTIRHPQTIELDGELALLTQKCSNSFPVYLMFQLF